MCSMTETGVMQTAQRLKAILGQKRGKLKNFKLYLINKYEFLETFDSDRCNEGVNKRSRLLINYLFISA